MKTNVIHDKTKTPRFFLVFHTFTYTSYLTVRGKKTYVQCNYIGNMLFCPAL